MRVFRVTVLTLAFLQLPFTPIWHSFSRSRLGYLDCYSALHRRQRNLKNQTVSKEDFQEEKVPFVESSHV